MKSIKQKLVNKSISFYDACKKYYNELTQEDVNYITGKKPWLAADHLHQHPFLTQKHVDFLVKKASQYAIKYLSHRFSEENITWLAENRPYLLKDLFK